MHGDYKMRGRIFVMSEQPYTVRFNLTHCYRCGKKLESGDKIFSKLNKISKRYHFRCAIESNLISEIKK